VTAVAGIHSPEDRRFVGLAAAAIDDYLARNPVMASRMGDHRFDARLPDLTADGVAEQARVLNRHIGALDSLDALSLSRINGVDITILRSRLAARVFELRTLAEHTWNPLLWNPGESLEPLLLRESGDPRAQLHAVIERMRALPEFLDAARSTLRTMPRIHVEVAVRQAEGLEDIVGVPLDELMARAPGMHDDVREAREELHGAQRDYVRWLRAQIPAATRDPRLGSQMYRAAFRHRFGPGITPEGLLADAEAEADRLREEMHGVAARLLGRSMATRRLVPDALTLVAEQAALSSPDELLPATRRALAAATGFASEHRLLAHVDTDIRVEAMPRVLRGVAVAYCDTPGNLEPVPAQTRIAVAPPLPDWAPSRRQSFLKEYHGVMLDVLMVHEGVPGHAAQLARARGAATPTAVRAVFPDSQFVEGWAVYAEQIMAQQGYVGSMPGVSPHAFRLLQLKMQLRTVINAILDVRTHMEAMAEPQARRLLSVQGLQEETEITQKWQRARLTHGQLSTYYAGNRDLRVAVADLSRMHPGWSVGRLHDTVLSHGSVAPAHLRTLTGLT